MRTFRFFGSLLIAILLAVVVFFVLYFFVPSVSEEFFGLSYQSSKDMEQLKSAVHDILEEARVPKVAIEEFIGKMDSAEFKANLREASDNGKDAVVNLLASVGKGIDFVSFESSQLGRKLTDGFSRLGTFTSKQLKSLQRLLSGALDSL
ncbi:MAG: hypothetical protein WCS59_06080 [Sphaerochaetaceae bacterium]|jgi:predicted PurR-regulated permease PerM|nr:hypothetical protein [Sphaerochaetaceae bacterium]MDY0370922.1 hypothetical protein [Sphaerochaetaceae bacterium]